MRITSLSFCISLFCFTLTAMQEQRGAKRVLFPAPQTSPSKGYGTDIDMGSPGTPASYKKTKASLGIHKVNFVNTTYAPVLLTYQGSAGTSSKLLSPYNIPDKSLILFKNEIVLSKPLYISTGKGLFRITLNTQKNRIELAQPVLYSADEPEGFAVRSGIDYQPEKQLHIKIIQDVKSGMGYPVVELSY